MNIRIFRIFIIVSLITLISNAQVFSAASESHLVPEEGIYGSRWFNPYYEAVGDSLLPLSLFPYRICQVVVFPSFSEEYGIYIEYDKEKPNNIPILFSVKFKKHLWTEMHRVLESKKDKRITEPDAQRYALSKIRSEVIRNEAPIDVKVVTLLEKIWGSMLSQVRYPEEINAGLDGVRYHFATFIKGNGYLTGQTWSPAKGTIVYDFVKLVGLLEEYASAKENDRKQISQNLQKKGEKLLERMNINK